MNKEFDLLHANVLYLKKRYKEAFEEYFRGFFDFHDPYAAFNLAFMYHQGIYVPRNYMMAHRFFIASSTIESGEAQFNLALMYLRGQGVSVDYQKAANYMKLSAARDCVNAQLYLGVAYTLGCVFDPVDIECISLIPFYRIIKRNPNVQLLFGSGNDQVLEDKRYEVLEADEYDAVEMFEAAARHKDTTYIEEQVGAANEALGLALIEGFGKNYDIAEGYRLLQIAAYEHNSKEAAFYLMQNKDKARIYGVDAEKTAYLIEGDTPR